ncbi:MAG: hypothetical protein K6A61_12540 [Butyrivibrio sp.]|nr:hypothetical protein [Butyrivibrio sp.]
MKNTDRKVCMRHFICENVKKQLLNDVWSDDDKKAIPLKKAGLKYATKTIREKIVF